MSLNLAINIGFLNNHMRFFQAPFFLVLLFSICYPTFILAGEEGGIKSAPYRGYAHPTHTRQATPTSYAEQQYNNKVRETARKMFTTPKQRSCYVKPAGQEHLYERLNEVKESQPKTKAPILTHTSCQPPNNATVLRKTAASMPHFSKMYQQAANRVFFDLRRVVKDLETSAGFPQYITKHNMMAIPQTIFGHSVVYVSYFLKVSLSLTEAKENLTRTMNSHLRDPEHYSISDCLNNSIIPPCLYNLYYLQQVLHRITSENQTYGTRRAYQLLSTLVIAELYDYITMISEQLAQHTVYSAFINTEHLKNLYIHFKNLPALFSNTVEMVVTINAHTDLAIRPNLCLLKNRLHYRHADQDTQQRVNLLLNQLARKQLRAPPVFSMLGIRVL